MDAAVVKPARVSVVRLGKMGEPIAERLLAADHPLWVSNRTRERAEALRRRGARILDSPREALSVADVCVTMVADDGALESVVLGDDGVLAGARAGAVVSK